MRTSSVRSVKSARGLGYSGSMFVLIEMNPYEAGEVLHIIGPFTSREEADKARDDILEAGGHPDSFWEVTPLLDPIETLNDILAGR